MTNERETHKISDKKFAEDVLKRHELARKHPGTEESVEVYLARRLLAADAKLCANQESTGSMNEPVGDITRYNVDGHKECKYIEVEHKIGRFVLYDDHVKAMNMIEQSSDMRARVPEELMTIATLLVSQNNRATDSPIFAVQQKRRHYGIDPKFGGEVLWLHSDGEEASEQESKELEAEYQENYEEPDQWTRTGYHDEWEFVTACFTEQGCKDYLARDGHNLNEPRIYAYGSYRNSEYRAVRNWLMSIAAAPKPERDSVSRDTKE